jgi:hypothetical protein
MNNYFIHAIVAVIMLFTAAITVRILQDAYPNEEVRKARSERSSALHDCPELDPRQPRCGVAQ